MTEDHSALNCVTCGGQCQYSPTDQALACLSCGAVYNLARPDDYLAQEEFHHNPDLPQTDTPNITASQTHQCTNCGGEVVFTGPALSENCPYCNGPMVLQSGDVGYDTMALIPFQIEAPLAQKCALKWAAQRGGCAQ